MCVCVCVCLFVCGAFGSGAAEGARHAAAVGQRTVVVGVAPARAPVRAVVPARQRQQQQSFKRNRLVS